MFSVDLRSTRVRTYGGEVHEGWEGDDPAGLGIYNMATIELEKQLMPNTRGTELYRVTKRPSASQLFRRIVSVGVMQIASEEMKNWYPTGPETPLTEAGNSRLSMKETD